MLRLVANGPWPSCFGRSGIMCQRHHRQLVVDRKRVESLSRPPNARTLAAGGWSRNIWPGWWRTKNAPIQSSVSTAVRPS